MRKHFTNGYTDRKNVLGHIINFESLYSTQGIQDIIDEIGRIQYGVYI